MIVMAIVRNVMRIRPVRRLRPVRSNRPAYTPPQPKPKRVPDKVTLFCWGNSGDVIMSRSIISDVIPKLQELGIDLDIRCKSKFAYLWEDLGVIIRYPEGELSAGALDKEISNDFMSREVIDLWFGAFGSGPISAYGLTYRTQIHNWNIYALKLNLPLINPSSFQRYLDFPDDPTTLDISEYCVLIENGPALSGQQVWDITDDMIVQIAEDNPGWIFLTATKTELMHKRVVDVSPYNLRQISSFSSQCKAFLCKLSGVMVSTFTSPNVGKPRIVAGHQLPFPIWEERGVEYVNDPNNFRGVVKDVLSRIA